MAVYKNYYNRRPLALTVYCLFLLCSTGYSSTEHHRHNKLDDSQVERGRLPDKTSASKASPIISCPHCDYINSQKSHKSEPDNIRLEAIRRQILSKLGMRDKPNITYSLPREVIMETLFRAEESSGFLDNYQTEDGGDVSSNSAKGGGGGGGGGKFETVDVDDFYGRTSEIISFAEDGE